MTADVLAPLLDLPGVADAATDARVAVDELRAHRVLRRHSSEVSAESALHAARASAALAGADHPLTEVRAGHVDDPVVQGALRVSAGLGALVGTWGRAPLQVLARLHVLAAQGLAESGDLGRPRPDAEVSARLTALAGLVVGDTAVPAAVLAAIVHGELLTLAPFDSAGGVVARGAARLTVVARGLDPKALGVPEVGHLDAAEEYAGSSADYAIGSSDGVARWVRHCCAALQAGAREGLAICEAIRRG